MCVCVCACMYVCVYCNPLMCLMWLLGLGEGGGGEEGDCCNISSHLTLSTTHHNTMLEQSVPKSGKVYSYEVFLAVDTIILEYIKSNSLPFMHRSTCVESCVTHTQTHTHTHMHTHSRTHSHTHTHAHTHVRTHTHTDTQIIHKNKRSAVFVNSTLLQREKVDHIYKT